MKNNKIATSWDRIKLDDDTDRLILNKVLEFNNSFDKNVCNKKYKNKTNTRRAFVPVLLGIAIIFAISSVTVIAYSYLSSNGKLIFSKTNINSDYNTRVTFLLDDTVRVNRNDIHGDVNECSEIIARQIENYDILSSISPYVVEKSFANVDDAVKYVGYADMKLPKLKEDILSSKVYVIGNEYSDITLITVNVEYAISDEVTAYTEAKIFTDSYAGEIGAGAESFSDAFAGVNFSGETVSINGREFFVVNSTEFRDNWLGYMVYWQENNVIYTLNIKYKDVDKDIADKVADKWMNSF